MGLVQTETGQNPVADQLLLEVAEARDAFDALKVSYDSCGDTHNFWKQTFHGSRHERCCATCF